jgi:hypothetical protein
MPPAPETTIPSPCVVLDVERPLRARSGPSIGSTQSKRTGTRSNDARSLAACMSSSLSLPLAALRSPDGTTNELPEVRGALTLKTAARAPAQFARRREDGAVRGRRLTGFCAKQPAKLPRAEPRRQGLSPSRGVTMQRHGNPS